MASENKPYVGDVTTTIEVETNKDLTGASVLRLEVTKPGASSVVNWDSSIKSGDNSIAEYDVVAADFSIEGLYRAQIYVEWASGAKFHGATVEFQVFGLGK